MKAQLHVVPSAHPQHGASAAAAHRVKSTPGAFREALGEALAHAPAGGAAPGGTELRQALAKGAHGERGDGEAALATGQHAAAAPHGVTGRALAQGEPRAEESGEAAPQEEESTSSRARPANRPAARAAQGEHPVPAHPTAAAPAAASTGAPQAPDLRRAAQDGVVRAAGQQGKHALAPPGPAKPLQDGEAASERKPRAKDAPARSVELAASAAHEPPPAFAVPQEAPAVIATRVDAKGAPAPALPPPPPGAPDVQGAVLKNAAHLRVDLGGPGALELHLRVQDGALHLRLDGEGSRAVEARSGELSRALAGEGLRLATVEAPPQDSARAGGDGGRSHGERRDAWQEAREERGRPAPPPPPSPAKTIPAASARGVHVKA